MTQLTERQKMILALVVRDHIETGKPVGSKRLVKQYRLDVSPATVRNELQELSELGYLRTTTGRVPTEEGYRYFVRQLMSQQELPDPTKRMITHQFYQLGHDVDRWMLLAASVLAHQAQAASLVTAPRPDNIVFKHLELINTHSRHVLLVLVLSGGEVRQQTTMLDSPVSQIWLSDISQRLNQLCQGKDLESINRLPQPSDPLEQYFLEAIVDEMRYLSGVYTGEVYRDGLAHILFEPKFGEVEAARRALRILEERPLLEDLLTRTVLATESGGVQVLIGGEGTWEELRQCSIVLARYGSPGIITGTLGVLGPMRMSYGRTVSTVRFMAGLLSDLVIDLQAD